MNSCLLVAASSKIPFLSIRCGPCCFRNDVFDPSPNPIYIPSMKPRSILFSAMALAALGVPFTSVAGPNPPAKNPPPMTTAPAEDGWRFRAAPYGWLTAIEGDVSIGHLSAPVDIGGFGASSDLVWQAFAGIGYNFTPSVSGVVGYRGLGIDYEKGRFAMDTVSHGPVIGLEIRW